MRPNRVAEGDCPRPPHHLTCGSASGGSGQIDGSRIPVWVPVSVMQFDPLCLQVRHPLFPQPRVVQRALHDPVAAHPPVAATTATGLHYLLRADAQRDEMAPPRARLPPLFPVT